LICNCETQKEAKLGESQLKINIVYFNPHNISLFLVNKTKEPWAELKQVSIRPDKKSIEFF
jgi:hypothetical protein